MDDDKKPLLQIADLTTMGIAMVMASLLGLFFGIFLDKHFETEPIFTLLFLLFGIAAGFRIMYQNYARYFREESKHDHK